jgi:hypothetical protein
MLHRRFAMPLTCAAVFASLALGAAGCIFSPDEDKDPPPPPDLVILPSTPPENLIKNLQTIYNDKEHSAIERLNYYEALFLHGSTEPPVPGYTFYFQEADVINGLPPSWGLSEELEAHRGLFTAQENAEIYQLTLAVTYGATDSLGGGWEEIFASNVQLRLMFNPNDGLEVNGGQAEFTFAPDATKPPIPTIPATQPPPNIRFYGGYWIAEWTDLPRP